MSTRRRAREVVLQLLYEDDLNPDQDASVAETFLSARLRDNQPLIDFATHLWRNVLKNRWEIDKALSACAKNWSLRRMAAIDRNVLRLGTYELLMTDTPGRVVINEAIELAKRYGDRQSSQFVNGILDRLLNDADTKTGQTQPDELTTAEETAEPASLSADSSPQPSTAVTSD